MTLRSALIAIVASLTLAHSSIAIAQEDERTEPFTAAERESIYNATIQKRADAALKELAITDTNKAERVHSAIVAQYRTLRARDEAMDTMFKTLSSNVPNIATNRPLILPILSRQLHDQFIRRLSADLTPEQVTLVKDKMTYNKVKVTYDAYCNIVSGLTDAQKARILRGLQDAREEAMDGGSADEKSAIFQKYKDAINDQLESEGVKVREALRKWEQEHLQASVQTRRQ